MICAWRRLRVAILVCSGLAASVPVTAQNDMVWRELDQNNLVYMTTGDGLVVIELNTVFAPKTVSQFKSLVKNDFYRGLSFYRVIEGFVAQGGDERDIDLPNSQPNLPGEFEIERSDDLPWTPVQTGDLYAPETGFSEGFAAARNPDNTWLTHCPGVIAMARNTEPDTGSTDFYIVIGQAPRYLDRNLTIFGRVVLGMDVVQRIRRGPALENGIIARDEDRSRISAMKLGAELDKAEQQRIYVMDTSSKGFSDYLDARRKRNDAFFHKKPPPVLDVCQVPVTSRTD